jgi:hypothetical protein
MRRTLLASVLLVAGSGCASSQVELKEPFDPQEYATCPPRGTNVVAGSTFGRTKAGGIISAAGRTVHLDPWTKYLHKALYDVRQKQAKDGFFREEREADTVTLDPHMFKCRRNATVGMDGNFRFDGVAPGTYYLSTYMSWLNGSSWVGAWNVTMIHVHDGVPVPPVVLSGFHFPDPRTDR